MDINPAYYDTNVVALNQMCITQEMFADGWHQVILTDVLASHLTWYGWFFDSFEPAFLTVLITFAIALWLDKKFNLRMFV